MSGAEGHAARAGAVGSKLGRVRALHREGGLKEAVRRALARLAGKIYRSDEHLILSRPLAEDPPAASEWRLVVRPIAEAEVAELLEFGSRYAFPGDKVLANYLSNGYPGFVALVEGRVIGYFWWVNSRTDPGHPDLLISDIRLGEDEVYGFSYFVDPDWRGQGTATEFISRVFLELRKLGYETIQGYVDAENRRARWLFTLMGYRVTRRVTVRRLLVFTLSNRRLFVRNLGLRSRHRFGERPVMSLSR